MSEEEQTSLLNVDQPEPESAEPEVMPHLAQTEETPVEEGDFEWGERPDFMEGLEQFWTAEDGPDLEGLAKELSAKTKSYNELRSKMSQGKHKAPKDGNYDMASAEGVEDDDPLLNDFVSFAKDNGLSQDQFDEILGMYMNHFGELTENIEADVQAEMGKLGKNGEKVLKATSQWIGKLQSSGVLTDAETNAIIDAANKAEFVTAFNKIREITGEQSIPSIDVMEGSQENLADLQAMLSDPRYGKDMHYTQQVERKFYEYHGEK